MNDKKMLFQLEYEWRVFRIYRKIINWLVKKGMKLSSPVLCYIQKRLDKHSTILMIKKRQYEKRTGKMIVYYKFDEI